MSEQHFTGGHQPGSPQPGGAVDPSTRTAMVLIAHLGAIVASFIPALVIFLIYKDRDGRIREESRQALNFNITMILAGIALGIVGGILSVISLGLLSFTTGLAGLPSILVLVFAIIAAVKYTSGSSGAEAPYAYPLSITFVR